ncbi:DUF4390 domain-containing protein [Nitrospira defluvii]|nr:DUF4390 domain-containing protein [Nitrospira defluvii]
MNIDKIKNDFFFYCFNRFDLLQNKAIFGFFFSLIFIFNPVEGFAKERIQDVQVRVSKLELFVSANLTGGFSEGVVNDIQNGISKEFFYYILLKRKEKNWFDEEVHAKTIRFSVKYDTLKKKYFVIQSGGEKVIEKRVADFKEMKAFVSRIDQIKLAMTATLKKGERYYVSVKSQMKAAELPFYLDYFLFFIPFLEIDTPWANSSLIALERGK